MLVRSGKTLNLSELPEYPQSPSAAHGWNAETHTILQETFSDYIFNPNTLKKPNQRGFLVYLALSSENQHITELDLSYNNISFLSDEEDEYSAQESTKAIEADTDDMSKNAESLATQSNELEQEDANEKLLTKSDEDLTHSDPNKSASQKRTLVTGSSSQRQSFVSEPLADDAKAIAMPGQLKKLILKGNHFSSHAMAILMQKIAGSKLEELDLSDCKLDEEAALVLADQLENIKQLRVLNLENNTGFYYPSVLQSLAISLTKLDAFKSVTISFNTLSFTVSEEELRVDQNRELLSSENIEKKRQKAELSLKEKRDEYVAELNTALERLAALKIYKDFQYEGGPDKFLFNIKGHSQVIASIEASISKFKQELEQSAQQYQYRSIEELDEELDQSTFKENRDGTPEEKQAHTKIIAKAHAYALLRENLKKDKMASISSSPFTQFNTPTINESEDDNELSNPKP